MIKKYKTQVLKDYKHNQAEADRLGAEGWRLVAVDKDGDGVFEQEQPARMEYAVVQPDLRRGLDADIVLNEMINAMAADGWRFVGPTTGARAMDMMMVFEREMA